MLSEDRWWLLSPSPSPLLILLVFPRGNACLISQASKFLYKIVALCGTWQNEHRFPSPIGEEPGIQVGEGSWMTKLIVVAPWVELVEYLGRDVFILRFTFVEC